jgi:hypothetical protein
MTYFRLIALLFAVGLAAGCHKSSPPSPDYQKARNLWLDLLRDKMGKAYTDPGADEVLALLARVDPNSMDAKVASDLKDEIEKGRREGLASDEEGRKQVEAARTALQNPMFVASGPAVYFTSDGGLVRATSDTGPSGPEMPALGMTADDFARKFGRCFEERGETLVNGAQGGRIFALRDLALCRQSYPEFLTRGVVLFSGTIANVAPLADLAPKKFKLVNGKLVPMTDKEAEEFEKQQKQKDQPPPPTPTPTAPVPLPPATPQGTPPPEVAVPQQVAPQADPGANPSSDLPVSNQP